jgi:hypothetical protein
MWQLNLAMSEEEAIQIVDLYDTSGKGEMRYEQLVKDVCAGVRRGVLGIRKKDHHAPSLGETTTWRRLAIHEDGRVTRNRRRSRTSRSNMMIPRRSRNYKSSTGRSRRREARPTTTSA